MIFPENSVKGEKPGGGGGGVQERGLDECFLPLHHVGMKFSNECERPLPGVSPEKMTKEEEKHLLEWQALYSSQNSLLLHLMFVLSCI